MTPFLRQVSVTLATVGALAGAPPGKAAPSLVGTLTCTAEPAPSDPKQIGGWKLSCAFHQEGTKTAQQYSGEISGLDQGTRLAAKALLVWTVLSAKNLETANLVGVYKTTNDATLPAQSLIGGRDQAIVLQPVADAGQNILPAVHLLQLELPKA
jgi:Protein of unknown function (DUF992)